MQLHPFTCYFVHVNVNKIKYMVGGYYRHPNTPVREFKESLIDTLNTFNSKNNVY